MHKAPSQRIINKLGQQQKDKQMKSKGGGKRWNHLQSCFPEFWQHFQFSFLHEIIYLSINRFLGSSRRGCLFPSPRKQEVLPPGDMPVPWPVQRQEWVGEEQASGGFTCPAWGSSGCLQGGVTLIFLFTLWLLILSLLAHRIFSTGLLPLGSGFLWSRPGSVYHQHGGAFQDAHQTRPRPRFSPSHSRLWKWNPLYLVCVSSTSQINKLISRFSHSFSFYIDSSFIFHPLFLFFQEGTMPLSSNLCL